MTQYIREVLSITSGVGLVNGEGRPVVCLALVSAEEEGEPTRQFVVGLASYQMGPGLVGAEVTNDMLYIKPA
jgi:hypothetical protein